MTQSQTRSLECIIYHARTPHCTAREYGLCGWLSGYLAMRYEVLRFYKQITHCQLITSNVRERDRRLLKVINKFFFWTK